MLSWTEPVLNQQENLSCAVQVAMVICFSQKWATAVTESILYFSFENSEIIPASKPTHIISIKAHSLFF